jgi:hypothetical protein
VSPYHDRDHKMLVKELSFGHDVENFHLTFSFDPRFAFIPIRTRNDAGLFRLCDYNPINPFASFATIKQELFSIPF